MELIEIIQDALLLSVITFALTLIIFSIFFRIKRSSINKQNGMESKETKNIKPLKQIQINYNSNISIRPELNPALKRTNSSKIYPIKNTPLPINKVALGTSSNNKDKFIVFNKTTFN
ncbi:MAG: hypothetical protein NZM09_02880 [Ignavibacterium sp.]|nr:hypothetical protein [Ignavibacterium sp.]MCX7610791.1 hypothetical protein [Ignavibacterium sp.]MDW8374621.1 hypothetical protein [Ignavibacteriales bacterium]